MESLNALLAEIDTDILLTYAIEYGTAFISAIAIFIIGKWIAGQISNLLRKAMEKNKLDSTIVSFLSNIIYYVLFAIVIIAAIGALGVETTSLAAVIAAAGLAIGLALQGSLSNFAAGVMIILFRPFRNGDYIDAAGVAGTVEEVNIFTTHLVTVDNCSVIVPNGSLIDGNIINYSKKKKRRVDLVIGVAYSENLSHVKQVLKDIVTSHDKILETPEYTLAVSELADNSVNLILRPWVKSEDYFEVKFELTEAIKNRFDEEGISIPFPQRDLHIIETAAPKLTTPKTTGKAKKTPAKKAA